MTESPCIRSSPVVALSVLCCTVQYEAKQPPPIQRARSGRMVCPARRTRHKRVPTRSASPRYRYEEYFCLLESVGAKRVRKASAPAESLARHIASRKRWNVPSGSSHPVNNGRINIHRRPASLPSSPLMHSRRSQAESPGNLSLRPSLPPSRVDRIRPENGPIMHDSTSDAEVTEN